MRSDKERNIIPLPVNTFLIMIFCTLLVVGGSVFVTSHVTRETQRATECLVEIVAEHRIDNRDSHEVLSEQNLNVHKIPPEEEKTPLPPPPSRLPRPDSNLLEQCSQYLDIRADD